MLEVSVLVISSIVNLLLGLFVFLKNSQSLTNRLFLLLTSSFILWAVVNYFSVHPVVFDQLFLIRLVLFCAALLNLTLFLNFLVFPNSSFSDRSRKIAKSVTAVTLIVMLMTLTPLVFKSLNTSGGTAEPVPNFGIGIFLIHTVSLIGASIFIITGKFIRAKDNVRNQLKIILFGVLSTFVLIIFSNFLMVVIFNNSSLVSFGPAYTLLFSGAFAYAIIRHKLFDVRLVVARSVAYVLSLGLLVGGYATATTIIANNLFIEHLSDSVTFLTNIVIFIIGVTFYPKIKDFFDKTTNKIFFRDTYEPQEFLDQLNKSIVSNIEIGILMRHSTTIIEENIKCGFCHIVIPETESTELRISGTTQAEYLQKDLTYLRGRLVGLGQKLVKVEDLPPNDDLLRSIFDKYDIAVVAHLTAISYGQSQTMAYIIFGTKKSGNVYSKQDYKIIDIIADELVIALQNALRFEEIQEFNVTLQNKVTTATTKLRKNNEKLKTIDQTKDEFISMASHQLRTPLTSVKGYLSMVLEGDAGEINATQKKLLDQAFVSSQRMVYLIADLLNVSRLRTGKFIIDAHPSNLADVVEAEVNQLVEQAKVKNIELEYDKPSEFPTLMIDDTKIRQVIMNFIDNALFYTPNGGKINVQLKADKNHIYFMVKDNGLGVPKEEQGHLFTKFYRAKNARNVRPDGTGLGLFMAKKVITAQGGNVLFESVENKGSTFGFSFSKKQLAMPTNPTDK